MNSSGAYDQMEREYVTAPPENEAEFSLTKIAGRYDRAPSSVARMSRINRWKEKRAAYRGEVTEITRTLDGDVYAERLHGLHGKAVEAAEVSIDAYITAVKSGDVIPSAGDATKWIALVRDIVNRPLGGNEDPDGREPLLPGINISPELSRGLLDRLAGLAAERLESGAGGRDLVAAGAPAGEGERIRVR